MAKQFENYTIYQILRYAAILHRICDQPALTTPFYRHTFENYSKKYGFYHPSQCSFYKQAQMGEDKWRPSFEALQNHGFIVVVNTETYNVYIDTDSYYNETVDITDEEYNNLPDFFKSKVDVQTRTRNIYRINEEKIAALFQFAEILNAII